MVERIKQGIQVIPIRPGESIIIQGIKSTSQGDAERAQKDQAITDTMQLVQGEWRIINGAFFGGDQDARDSLADLARLFLPRALELQRLSVSYNELGRAIEETIIIGQDKMIPSRRKKDMAEKITRFIFDIASEDQAKKPPKK